MAVEFAMFLPRTRVLTYWLHTVAELIVSAINILKTMGRGHAVHKWQAILSTTVVIFHTFCMVKKNELTPRRVW